jgi:hypothetical protein
VGFVGPDVGGDERVHGDGDGGGVDEGEGAEAPDAEGLEDDEDEEFVLREEDGEEVLHDALDIVAWAGGRTQLSVVGCQLSVRARARSEQQLSVVGCQLSVRASARSEQQLSVVGCQLSVRASAGSEGQLSVVRCQLAVRASAGSEKQLSVVSSQVSVVGGEELVEDVAAEGMVGGDARVVEVEGGEVGHSEALHDAAGGRVGDGGDGDDAGQAEVVEGVVDDGGGSLGSEAEAPEFLGEAPADFDRGLGKAGNGVGHGLEAEDSGEFASSGGGRRIRGEVRSRERRASVVGSAHAESLTGEAGLKVGDLGVAFFAGEDGGEELADERIGVHGGVRLEVFGLPGAESEAWSAQDHGFVTVSELEMERQSKSKVKSTSRFLHCVVSLARAHSGRNDTAKQKQDQKQRSAE